MKLSANLERLNKEFDIVPGRDFLFSRIRIDGEPMVRPMIVDHSRGTSLLVRQQEQGNLVHKIGQDDRAVYYQPWMTLDKSALYEDKVHQTVSDALLEVDPDVDRLDIGNDVPWKHVEELAKQFHVHTGEHEREETVVYSIDSADVLNRFHEYRSKAVQVAEKILEGTPHLKNLRDGLNIKTDTRFEKLRRLLESRALDGLLVEATPNVSEILGIPVHDGLRAFVTSDSIFVLCRGVSDADQRITSRKEGVYPSLKEAIIALAQPGRIGVEEEHISGALVHELIQRGCEVEGISGELGAWRDVRDGEDLAAYVIGARASCYAIEEALDKCGYDLLNGETSNEQVVLNYYLTSLKEFASEFDCVEMIEPYFENLTAGSRMLFPGPATDYEVSLSERTVQLDAGVKVCVNGVTLATTDMGRSLALDEGSSRSYSRLLNVVRNTILPSIAVGRKMSDVHRIAISVLDGMFEEFVDWGLLGDRDEFITNYPKRNVGHLMGKQESFVHEFKGGFDQLVENGWVGAAELPWRYNLAALSAEDMWTMFDDRVYNLTLRNH